MAKSMLSRSIEPFGVSRDPPAGMPARQGLYYNPYFPGGLLAMPPPLSTDGQVEYEELRTLLAHA
eukprot:3027277-Amphidinium_carterae.2